MSFQSREPRKLSIDDRRFLIEQPSSNRQSKIDNRKSQGVGVPVPQAHPVGLHEISCRVPLEKDEWKNRQARPAGYEVLQEDSGEWRNWQTRRP